jgi:hypothetical protein
VDLRGRKGWDTEKKIRHAVLHCGHSPPSIIIIIIISISIVVGSWIVQSV